MGSWIKHRRCRLGAIVQGLALTSLALQACATGMASMPGDTTVRELSGLPERFMVLEGDNARVARPDEGCRSPMVDPRDGTRVLLRRSSEARGDYEAPAGAYGLSPREYLRLDCATGHPLGAVSR